MDNPHVIWIWNQLELERRQEVVEMSRLARVVCPDRQETGQLLLGVIGSFLVRAGLKLTSIGKPADVSIGDQEALWKLSRRAA